MQCKAKKKQNQRKPESKELVLFVNHQNNFNVYIRKPTTNL